MKTLTTLAIIIMIGLIVLADVSRLLGVRFKSPRRKRRR